MVPPVPIPNTVVKRVNVESTWLETAREDRKLPVKRPPFTGWSFYVPSTERLSTSVASLGYAKGSVCLALSSCGAALADR